MGTKSFDVRLLEAQTESYIFWYVCYSICAACKIKKSYSDSMEGLTSQSILFVSNTLDPVTSLAKYVTLQIGATRFSLIISSGQEMSRRFNGSRLLQQDSEGVSNSPLLSLTLSRSRQLKEFTIYHSRHLRFVVLGL